ncbi:MAG: hypothetical protein K0Q85_1401 [Caproiciproducens sp.]|nr:hypothetical protein [Caproiciproducens sp.]
MVEAAKLCQAGFTQVHVAKILGIHPRMVSDWFEQYGADNFMPGKVCEYCQKSLAGMPRLSQRKYCSDSCENKARYYRTHKPYGNMTFDPILRARGLELYWGGLSQKSIAEHLGVAHGMVCSWIHDFGELRKCQPVPEILALRSPEERIINAENATQWLEALRDFTLDSLENENTVHLVCKRAVGCCGMNKLVTIITDRLHLDPMSGETYAFCDSLGFVISTLFWDGRMFRIGKYPKPHGGFMWQKPKWGEIFIIRESEFESLIYYQKKRRIIGRNLSENSNNP